MAGVLSDYSAGINQVFSNMYGTPWYLGGNYNLIPLLGLDDQQLQAVLTKEQMDAWAGSQEFANASSLWQVVKQMHARVQKVHRTARAVIQD